MNKCYSELKTLKTFEERYEYLKISGVVGDETFGYERYLNQQFYKSTEWRSIRNDIIVRDNGCDLGIDGYEIYDKIIIHHINPICIDDILDFKKSILLNPENLICTSYDTHEAIHYGNEYLLKKMPIIRTPNDTCPWK